MHPMQAITSAGFEIDLTQYVPLELGSRVLGWVPCAEALIESSKRHRNTTVIIGSMAFIGQSQEELGFSRLQDSSVENIMSSYLGPIITNLPVNSVDYDENQKIILSTQRSSDTFYVTIDNCFRLLPSFVQSEMHRLSPVDALHFLCALDSFDYPKHLVDELSWRGQQLSELVHDSLSYIRATNRFYGAKVIRRPQNFGFSDFVALQSKWTFDPEIFKQGRELTYRELMPDNILTVTYTEKDEFLIEKVFNEKHIMAYLRSVNHSPEYTWSHTFFLCKDTDPILDWIVGEKIPLRMLYQITFSLFQT